MTGMCPCCQRVPAVRLCADCEAIPTLNSFDGQPIDWRPIPYAPLPRVSVADAVRSAGSSQTCEGRLIPPLAFLGDGSLSSLVICMKPYATKDGGG